MKRFVPLLCALALAAVGCLDITGPSDGTPPTVSQDVTVIINPAPDSTPPPAPSDDDALCPAARFVEASGFGGPAPPTVVVGALVRLDATPLDAQRQPRLEACDVQRGIEWVADGPCTLDDATSFTPTLTAVAAGTCVATAFVETVSDSVTFEIQ